MAHRGSEPHNPTVSDWLVFSDFWALLLRSSGANLNFQADLLMRHKDSREIQKVSRLITQRSVYHFLRWLEWCCCFLGSLPGVFPQRMNSRVMITSGDTAQLYRQENPMWNVSAWARVLQKSQTMKRESWPLNYSRKQRWQKQNLFCARRCVTHSKLEVKERKEKKGRKKTTTLLFMNQQCVSVWVDKTAASCFDRFSLSYSVGRKVVPISLKSHWKGPSCSARYCLWLALSFFSSAAICPIKQRQDKRADDR